jgi:hypothetical protein
LALVLLDTSVLIAHLRGSAEVTRRLIGMQGGGDMACTCGVIALEVERGARAAEIPRIRRLLDSLVELPVSVSAGLVAGRWQAAYGKRGVRLGDADVLIAGAAHAAGAVVATANVRHFPMPELKVEEWPST